MNSKLTKEQRAYIEKLIGPRSRVFRPEKVKKIPPPKPLCEKELTQRFKRFKLTKIYGQLFIGLYMFHSVPPKVAEGILRRAFVEGIMFDPALNRIMEDERL